ncbi:hypothetical protein P280DRAFT_389644 [Massarina eburnea CBS 473.64]|uniref:Rhodopsin domain-containing protein n=1 Tax=Massarina eburnea CBS 473.64 TaxID=1395130 RepID=A0A6A6SEX0_9PLEO|nr:hypothetical protein P280DRAFT_389644 [Massarina eburnea CBS 473.64]
MVDNRGPELAAVCSTFVAMAFVSMALRVYVRLRMVRNFGWDDTFMLLAMLTYIMFATCAIGGVHWGTGRHMSELDNEHKMKAMRYWWFCYIGYCCTMITAKISIGIFLLRVTVRALHRWIIYTAMALSVFAGLAFFFVTLFQCSPISFFWDRFTGLQGGCVDVNVIIGLTFLYSGVAAISDATFGILPIFLVWNLNMSRNSKLMLIPILSMACIASLAVFVRMAFVMDFRSADFLYATVDIAIWSDIEQGLAITAGSLATLRPLFRTLSTQFGFSSSSNTNPKASGKDSQEWYKPKQNGPLGKMSLTRPEKKRYEVEGGSDEYTLGNLPPIKLRGGDEKSQQKVFASWRIQAGDSKEDFHKTSIRGITRQDDYHVGRS